jgi:hypothetical protein
LYSEPQARWSGQALVWPGECRHQPALETSPRPTNASVLHWKSGRGDSVGKESFLVTTLAAMESLTASRPRDRT